MSKVRMLEKALNAGRPSCVDKPKIEVKEAFGSSNPHEIVKDVLEEKKIEPVVEVQETKKTPQNKTERFKGTGGGIGRKVNAISVEDLLKQGQIIEREMRNTEKQTGIAGRHKELHLLVGKGYLNTTRLVRDNKLTVKKVKGCDSLITTRNVSDDLKHAVIDFLETGNIDDDLNDRDRGILYAFIAHVDHYGNLTPEDFYKDRLMGILQRAKLAPINPNLESEFDELLAISKTRQILSKTAIKYLEESAKQVFKMK